MFNSKRIILAISLLSIVVLSGALLAGPAFAGKPVKVDVCHYAAAETLVTVVDGITIETHEPERWSVVKVSESSVADHEANHYDEHGMYDFAIDDTDFLADGITLNTANDRGACDDLMANNITVDEGD